MSKSRNIAFNYDYHNLLHFHWFLHKRTYSSLEIPYGNEKNMGFYLIPKSHKVGEENRTELLLRSKDHGQGEVERAACMKSTL